MRLEAAVRKGNHGRQTGAWLLPGGLSFGAVLHSNSPMNPLCIFLIDDHPLFRRGLRMVLEGGLGAADVHEVASVEEALGAGAQPDLLLVDIFLSGLDGLSGISLLRDKWPDASLVMVTSDASNTTITKALDSGALACLSKATPAQQMLDTIKLVLSRRGPSLSSAKTALRESAETARSLSERQLQVLDFVGQGLSNRAIAQRLHLSEHTVRWYVHAILAALCASSRSEAVFLARQRGWLP
jgi:DNA-binding NarL/FixJ family response regulator